MRQRLTDLSVRKLENHKRRPGQLNQEITPSSMQQMLLKNATYKFLMNTLLTFNIFSHISAQISRQNLVFSGSEIREIRKSAVRAAQGFRTNLLQHRVLPRLRHRHPCHAWQIDGHDGIWISQFEGRHLTKATGSKWFILQTDLWLVTMSISVEVDRGVDAFWLEACSFSLWCDLHINALGLYIEFSPNPPPWTQEKKVSYPTYQLLGPVGPYEFWEMKFHVFHPFGSLDLSIT